MTIDIERAVLAGVLVQPEHLDDITLAARDFSAPEHERLWTVLNHMRETREVVTPLSVAQAIHRDVKDLPRLTPTYVADLVSHCPAPSSLAIRYARDVANEAGNRRLANAGTRAIQLAQGGGDAQENQDLVRAEVESATTGARDVDFIGSTFADSVAGFSRPSRAIPTPWPDLNHIVKGWRPGALYTVGARPGVGKSILALQAAIALSEHGSVSYHSLEMPNRELHARVAAQMAEVALGRLDGNSTESDPMTDRDRQRIEKITPAVEAMPLAINDSTAATIAGIRSHARATHRQNPLSAVVIDYLQLIQTAPGERRPRHEVVAEFARSLKNLAIEMDVPVIALAQLNRESTKENRRPTMADLKESGAIEQDSDVVILLHSEDELSPDLEVIVAKNRHGIRSRAKVTRRGEFARLDTHQWTPTHH